MDPGGSFRQTGGLARRSLADYQRGVDLVETGYYDLALSHLENCLYQEADFFEARLLLIRLLRRSGRYTEALSFINSFPGGEGKALEFNLESVPIALFAGSPTLAIRLGWNVLESLPTLGRHQVAVPEAMGSEQALNRTDDTDLRRWLVLMSLFEKGPRAALRGVQYCLDRDPSWLKGHFLRAGILEILGDFVRAEAAYARILEIDSSQSEPLEALRRLWHGCTLEKNPFREEYLVLFISEANRLLQAGPSETISRVVESWFRMFPESDELLGILVNLFVTMGQYDRALGFIDHLPAHRLNMDLLCLKAEVLEKAGNVREAGALFHAVLVQNPRQKRACDGIARLGAVLENHDQVVRGIEKALTLCPDDPSLWYTLALLLKQGGKQDEALAALEETVRLDPHHQGGLYALGIERLHQHRVEEAVLLFGDLVVLDPENQEARRNLAIAQTQCHQWEEALETWRRLLRMAPQDPQALVNIQHLKDFFAQRGKGYPPGRKE